MHARATSLSRPCLLHLPTLPLVWVRGRHAQERWEESLSINGVPYGRGDKSALRGAKEERARSKSGHNASGEGWPGFPVLQPLVEERVIEGVFVGNLDDHEPALHRERQAPQEEAYEYHEVVVR